MKTHEIDNSYDPKKVILWQYQHAANLIALLSSCQQFFKLSTEKFWKRVYDEIFNFDTATEFGLWMWGLMLGKDRPKNKETGKPIDNDLWRRYLRCEMKRLVINGSSAEINEWLYEMFPPMYNEDGKMLDDEQGRSVYVIDNGLFAAGEPVDKNKLMTISFGFQIEDDNGTACLSDDEYMMLSEMPDFRPRPAAVYCDGQADIVKANETRILGFAVDFDGNDTTFIKDTCEDVSKAGGYSKEGQTKYNYAFKGNDPVIGKSVVTKPSSEDVAPVDALDEQGRGFKSKGLVGDGDKTPFPLETPGIYGAVSGGPYLGFNEYKHVSEEGGVESGGYPDADKREPKTPINSSAVPYGEDGKPAPFNNKGQFLENFDNGNVFGQSNEE